MFQTAILSEAEGRLLAATINLLLLLLLLLHLLLLLDLALYYIILSYFILHFITLFYPPGPGAYELPLRLRAWTNIIYHAPSPPAKSLDFEGFDSSRLLILRVGILMSIEFDRESPERFDSRTLNRKTLSRWTGRNYYYLILSSLYYY